MKMVKNRPSQEGRILGEQLARLTEKAIPATLAKFPRHPMPCKSCAYRAGTFPNGCVETVMDALKATMEGEPFYCHQPKPDKHGRPTTLCAGWAISQVALDGKEPIPTPWPFSHELHDSAENYQTKDQA